MAAEIYDLINRSSCLTSIGDRCICGSREGFGCYRSRTGRVLAPSEPSQCNQARGQERQSGWKWSGRRVFREGHNRPIQVKNAVARARSCNNLFGF